MFDISQVDGNFKIRKRINRDDIEFYKVDEAPFKIYGIFKENGKYKRLPESVARTVNEGVYNLHTHTSGGRLKFVTDSPYIAIHTTMNNICKMCHFAFTGSIAYDLYVDNNYTQTFIPPIEIEDGYESIIDLKEKKLREITINFPLYSGVNDIYVGLQEGSVIKEASSYKNEKPIVYYGSSITQGGCASRPGMSYQNIIAREFGYDYINLGFSGSARGEVEIAEYIKNLDMSAFVYDYDYNAPTTQQLKDTHERMFKIVREKNPDLPVIMMSRPKHLLTEEEKERQSIVETTYKNAVAAGDKNVYFLNGADLTELCKDNGTVDNCHPTDFGFASIANALSKVLKDIEI